MLKSTERGLSAQAVANTPQQSFSLQRLSGATSHPIGLHDLTSYCTGSWGDKFRIRRLRRSKQPDKGGRF